MLVPLGFRIPEDVFLGMGFKTLLESPCRDDEFGPIPVDQGDEGTAFGAKLFGKPFGFGQFVTFDQFLSCKPCLLYTSPSPRDYAASRMPSSA